MDSDRIARIIDKYLSILDFEGGPIPDIVVRNNLGAKWLGRCTFSPKNPGNTTIELQQAVLGDQSTLERVLAHELIHHREFLTLSDREKKLLALGVAHVAHGDTFREGAELINAVMGANFVTVTSDLEYVVAANEKPFFLLVAPITRERYGYAWAARLSPAMKQGVERQMAGSQARLFQVTEVRWTRGQKIGKFQKWSVPANEQDRLALEQLYQQGEPLDI
jgi:hypothetical protein